GPSRPATSRARRRGSRPARARSCSRSLRGTRGRTASVEPALPPELPSLRPVSPGRAPETTVTTLGNGLAVWVVRLRAVPLVSIRLAVRAGRVLDARERPGFANLMASAMREGSLSRTGGELSAIARSAGAELAVGAGDDLLVAAASGLAARLSDLLDVVADESPQPALPGAAAAPRRSPTTG